MTSCPKCGNEMKHYTPDPLDGIAPFYMCECGNIANDRELRRQQSRARQEEAGRAVRAEWS